jgi:hypothetical protein
MTDARTPGRRDDATGEAEVWIDNDQAVIVEGAADGHETVQHVGRESAESQRAFELRTIREIVERDRLFVFGSTRARIGFERAYVEMTHRPDRLVDGEPLTPTRGSSAKATDGQHPS